MLETIDGIYDGHVIKPNVPLDVAPNTPCKITFEDSKPASTKGDDIILRMRALYDALAAAGKLDILATMPIPDLPEFQPGPKTLAATGLIILPDGKTDRELLEEALLEKYGPL